jgi:hypothetical protein
MQSVNDTWLLAVTENGTWHPAIGDPTPIGWLTTFAYLIATLTCGNTWLLERRAMRQGRTACPVFWMILTFLLFFLGINKQLDLQTLLNDLGRIKAHAEGWYANRRVYQVVFIGVVAIAGLAAIGLFSWLARNRWKQNFVALLGTVFLYVFVLIRASSIHHVDVVLQWKIAGAKWNWVLELGGITVVLLGAVMALRAPRQDEIARGGDPTGPMRYTFVRGVLVAEPSGQTRSRHRGQA